MVFITDKNIPGKLHRVKGNQPILLNDPQIIWLVKSGAIATFAVTIKDGAAVGTRRYLFNCESQEVLFGTLLNLYSSPKVSKSL